MKTIKYLFFAFIILICCFNAVAYDFNPKNTCQTLTNRVAKEMVTDKIPGSYIIKNLENLLELEDYEYNYATIIKIPSLYDNELIALSINHSFTDKLQWRLSDDNKFLSAFWATEDDVYLFFTALIYYQETQILVISTYY